MVKRTFSLLVFSLIFAKAFGQKDTEFWFSAPYISESHGNLPIMLQIAAYDQPANVEISLPAHPNFRTIYRVVNPYSLITIDLSRFAKELINYPYNTIGDKGVYIKSNSYISVSYDVLGYSEDDNQNVNSDIFVLKGRNALGKDFFTPFQTSRPNESSSLRDAYSGFSIVATQNNTIVNITPSQDLFGYPKGVPFSVTLQKGQTYACRALKRNGPDHPSGTRVKSNNPIAVTIYDDSVVEQTSFDLLGDQLVPVDVVGTRYIIPAIPGASFQETYILATEDQTEITIGDNNASPFILNKGETIAFPLSGNGTYVQGSKPVYAWHVTAMSNETTAALLPDVECSGSRSIVFTRTSPDTLGIVIIARTGSENNFLVNGQPGIIRGEDFKAIEGTNDFKTLYTTPSLSSIPFNKVNLLTNTSASFQLGFITKDNEYTSRFGYYSSFSAVNLGPDLYVCPGETVQLGAGPDSDSYIWNMGDRSQSITTDSSGIYIVTVTTGDCSATDSIEVKLHSLPHFDLGDNVTACMTEDIVLSGPEGNFDYYWTPESRERKIEARTSGRYTLKVIDKTSGCSQEDDIDVHFYALPQPQIYFSDTDENLCSREFIEISTDNFPVIQWSTGDTSRHISVVSNNTYKVTVSDHNNCQNSITRTLDCSPFVKLYNLITPNGDGSNDYFIINGHHNQKYTLTVYNRWGDRVYQQESYNNQWSPNDLGDGVYYYSLLHSDKDILLKGWFLIKR